jgi:hypothetical protein
MDAQARGTGRAAADPALPGARKIAQWIRRRKPTRFTVREVRRRRWREFAKDQDRKLIMASLNLLDAMGWVRLEDKYSTVRGGRPTLEAVVSSAAWAEGSRGE